jgi:dehydratase
LRTTVLTVALAIASLLTLATPAAATDINFACAGATPLGMKQFSLPQTINATAPPTVAPGAPLGVIISSAPTTIPGTVGDHRIKQIQQ